MGTRGRSHLEHHSKAHNDDNLCRVVEAAEATEDAVLESRARRRIDPAPMLGVLLLRPGNVQEATVGGVEEGDAKGQVDAHDPILGLRRREGPEDVPELHGYPIQVQESDGRQRQRKAADAQDGHLAAGDEVRHARQEECGPDTRPAREKDAHAAQLRLRLGAGLEAEFGTHDQQCLLTIAR